MEKFLREQLVFIDESAKDEKTSCRKFGYALSGTRVEKIVFMFMGNVIQLKLL